MNSIILRFLRCVAPTRYDANCERRMYGARMLDVRFIYNHEVIVVDNRREKVIDAIQSHHHRQIKLRNVITFISKTKNTDKHTHTHTLDHNIIDI